MSKRFDWLVRGGTLVSSDAAVPADVAIVDGLVAEVADEIDPGLAREVYDAEGKLVFPGIIDAHSHPYYDDLIDTFSVSAAHGGITTLVPFAGRAFSDRGEPQPIPDLVSSFISDARRTSVLDFGVHAILSGAGQLAAMVPDLVALGVRSVKVFMAFPGQRMLADDAILEVMQASAANGVLCMVHCENGPGTAFLERRSREAGETDARAYVRSRPPELEAEAVYRALALARLARCDTYLVHVTASESLEVVRRQRSGPGPRTFVETCPHYLLLTRADQERQGAFAKISPPMREETDVSALWRALQSGEVDVIASDASGQRRSRKLAAGEDVLAAPYGMPGVEHMVQLLFDAAVSRRGLDPQVLARVLCEAPADIFGLADRKGRLRKGLDGDVVVIDPHERWVIRGEEQHGNSDYSVYEGRTGLGKPVFSLQRGRPVLREGRVIVRPGDGNYLPSRPSAEQQ